MTRARLYPDHREPGVRPGWDHCSMVPACTGDLLRRMTIPAEWGNPVEAVAWFRADGTLAVLVADYPNGRRVSHRQSRKGRTTALTWWRQP